MSDTEASIVVVRGSTGTPQINEAQLISISSRWYRHIKLPRNVETFNFLYLWSNN